MRPKKQKILVSDFETTVFKEQEFTEVWAAATVELYTEDVIIHQSISDWFKYILKLNSNLIVYFHNLKFDGEFILSYLMTRTDFEQAKENEFFVSNKEMPNKSFKYMISDMGQWYTITIKYNRHIIEIRDSLKIIPVSVKAMGKGFKTKHQKSSIEYEGYRYSGCEITEEERYYISNDVLVVKEALEHMYNDGHNKLTIGACAMADFKKRFSKSEWGAMFPNLYELEIPDFARQDNNPAYKSIGDYIRYSYRGAWTYLVKGKENRLFTDGLTLDVNSLYPSQMHSESGNYYPYGAPEFFVGEIPSFCTLNHYYYFVHIQTRFKLKKGYLPFIQIKHSFLYKPTEHLETSDLYNYKTGEYNRYYYDSTGEKYDTFVDLYLTQTDYELIKEHYDLLDCKIIDGCYFKADIGIFDNYINKYRKIKMTTTGAQRTIAKLFQNSLYGKFATSQDSSFKTAKIEKGVVKYNTIHEYDKKPGYIPIGAAITSYARNFTIRAAQQNYYGPNKPGFIYADTDSIHIDLPLNKIKGIKIDDVQYNCWKCETQWDKALFVRQKTYIEHDRNENDLMKSYIMKCAGLPDRCKDYFLINILGLWETLPDDKKSKYDEAVIEWMQTRYKLTDFKRGFKIPGKLYAKRIPGGIVLKEDYYRLR